MKLIEEDRTELVKPSREQLTAAVSRLAMRITGYLILKRAPHHYLQVASSKTGGFDAEYRAGKHHRYHFVAPRPISPQDLVALLEAYRDDGAWKSLMDWQPSDAAARKTPLRLAPADNLVSGILLVVGVGAMGASGYLAASTYHFIARAVEVPGVVIQMVPRGQKTAPVVEYADSHGKLRKLESPQASSPPSYFRGERVKVLYDPADAANARIKTFAQLWGVPLVLFVLGLAFGGIAAAWWVLFHRRRRLVD